MSSSLAPERSLRVKVLRVSKEPANPRRLNIQATSLTDQKPPQPKTTLNLSLEGVWAQNHISPNSILHLINPHYDPALKLYQIDNSRGFLVLEPDNLLTCTYVASSLFCERKTWLNHVFLGQVGTNRAMLVGTLVHEVFQHALKEKINQLDRLVEHLDHLLEDATVMMEIYSVELDLRQVRAEAVSYLSSVKEWVDNYMLKSGTHPLTNEQDVEVKITKIKDIEENVWSTKYGLKGKIDVTGLVRVHNKRDRTTAEKIIPLELKTGNPNLSSSHSAQVSLYSMMIEDRYAQTNQGFVIYLKDKAAMHNITLTNNIKRDLIQRRNQVNYSMKNYFLGPEMIDQPRLCKNCDRLTECIVMSQLYTPGQIDQYSSMKSLEGEAVGHLDQKFMNFFQKYHEKLIAILISKKTDDSFWNHSSEEAERRGVGFGKLQVEVSGDAKLVTFRRHPKHSWTEAKGDESFSSQEEHKQPVKKVKISDFFSKASPKSANKKTKPFDTRADFSRCRVAISLDPDESDMKSQNSSTAIAIGFVNEIKEDQISMKLYEGGFEAAGKAELMFRLDKIEKRVQVDIERTVLVRLLAREDWRCDRVRRLILEADFCPEKNIKLNHFVMTTGFDEIANLDSMAQKLVVDAFATDNYYILNERYASSRSEVDKIISIFSRVVSLLSRSVLIVAQNVDNLLDLMKLLRMKKIKFILIDDGKSTKARNVFSSHIPRVSQSFPGFDLALQYESYIRQHELSPVVITSYAMSIGGLYFVRKTFDYCVAYDCDKTELLLSLSPMFCSDRVLVVDVREAEGGKKEGEGETAGGSGGSGETERLAKEERALDDEVTLGGRLRRLRPWIY